MNWELTQQDGFAAGAGCVTSNLPLIHFSCHFIFKPYNGPIKSKREGTTMINQWQAGSIGIS